MVSLEVKDFLRKTYLAVSLAEDTSQAAQAQSSFLVKNETGLC